MQEIEGLLYDGRTSSSRPAKLAVYVDGTVRLSWQGGEQSFQVDALDIPARLGDTPRRIALPDGSEFETGDNAAVDAIAGSHGPPGHGLLHWLESRLGIVIGATLVVLLAGGLFAVYGIPALAREAAFALSPAFSARLGHGTLSILDQTLEPSQLDEARQASLRERFEHITDAEEGQSFELLFREGGLLGANAFALPSGTVVMTDELVELAAHDDGLVAVFAHEVGHVVYRHGLRQAIQSSLLALGIVLVTGDLSSTSGFVAALPALLAESRFSRDFEREADDYALSYLDRAGIDPERFAELLQRLEQAAGERALNVPFLSSHPSTEERVHRLRSSSRS